MPTPRCATGRRWRSRRRGLAGETLDPAPRRRYRAGARRRFPAAGRAAAGHPFRAGAGGGGAARALPAATRSLLLAMLARRGPPAAADELLALAAKRGRDPELRRLCPVEAPSAPARPPLEDYRSALRQPAETAPIALPAAAAGYAAWAARTGAKELGELIAGLHGRHRRGRGGQGADRDRPPAARRIGGPLQGLAGAVRCRRCGVPRAGRPHQEPVGGAPPPSPRLRGRRGRAGRPPDLAAARLFPGRVLDQVERIEVGDATYNGMFHAGLAHLSETMSDWAGDLVSVASTGLDLSAPLEIAWWSRDTPDPPSPSAAGSPCMPATSKGSRIRCCARFGQSRSRRDRRRSFGGAGLADGPGGADPRVGRRARAAGRQRRGHGERQETPPLPGDRDGSRRSRRRQGALPPRARRPGRGGL